MAGVYLYYKYKYNGAWKKMKVLYFLQKRAVYAA